MGTYNLTLSTAEDIALGFAAANQQEWIDNVVHERCRVAVEEIVKICVDRCVNEGIQIPLTKEDMVILAKEKGWLEEAKVTQQG